MVWLKSIVTTTTTGAPPVPPAAHDMTEVGLGAGAEATLHRCPPRSHTVPVPSCASLHFLPEREEDAFPRLGIPFLTSSCLKAAPHGSGRGIFSACPAFTSWMRLERGSDIKQRAALALKGILSFLPLSHRKTSVKRGW